jgi:hypothetical protein
VLVASPFRKSGEHTLALLDKKTGHSTLVKTYDRSLVVGWSPDSAAFFINDALGSSEEQSYLYSLASKKIPADHTYFRVRRWVNGSSVALEYCGHNSSDPAQQFDFLYIVNLSPTNKLPVKVRRTAANIGPLSIFKPECSN